MSQSKYTTGIIGNGIVGKAVASFFIGSKIFDKFSPFDPIEEVLNRDIIFVCVPTPFKEGKGFDKTALEDAFENISKDGKERIVVIKSTSIPGTTDYFQDKYPHLKVLFNPEFLSEKTAQRDFVKPDKQLIGFTPTSHDIAEQVLSLLPDAPYKKIMPAKAAELAKYAINSFYATKVVFGNMLYDLSESLGIDYNIVKGAFVSDKRICDSHFDVMHDGYRGFGGKCLPKDLKCLLDLGEQMNVRVDILDSVDKMNEGYRNL